MLDHQQRGAGLQELAESGEQFCDVIEVQAGGGLVEDIEDAAIVAARQVRGEFQALGFASREGGGGLPQAQVAETDFTQHLQLRNDFRDVAEKREGFPHGHLQHVVDVFSMEFDVEDAALETRAAAFFANQLDVGEELHFDGDSAVALAGLTAATRNVEGKMPGGVAAALGVGSFGEDVADGVESLEIGGGIRTRGAADRGLVDDDHFADFAIAVETIAEFLDAVAVVFRGERAIEDVMDESGLSRAADTGYHRERSEWNHQVDILQVVQACAGESQKLAVGLVAIVGNGDAQFPVQIAAGQRFVLAQHGGVRAGEKQMAAKLAGAGAQIDHGVCGFDGVGIVLDDQHGVAEVAERFKNVDQALRVARMQADGGLIENVQSADEMGTERGRQLNALGLAAR